MYYVIFDTHQRSFTTRCEAVTYCCDHCIPSRYIYHY